MLNTPYAMHINLTPEFAIFNSANFMQLRYYNSTVMPSNQNGYGEREKHQVNLFEVN